MDKSTRNLLIGIIGTMLVFAIILIVCITFYEPEQLNSSTEALSTEQIGENRVQDFYEDASESSTEISQETNTGDVPENAQMNYAEDIAAESSSIPSVLSLNGKDYTIPCKFSSFGNDFEYLEPIPETLPMGGYQELHIVKDSVDTGVSIMVVNTTEKEISFNDAYVNFISIGEGCDSISASCVGLSYGSIMADIKQAIESGEYAYESATYDYEQMFLISISDSVSVSVVYDRDEEIVTSIFLEYAIN